MTAAPVRLTAKQRRLLEILEHWDGHGTIEVCIQFGEYDSDGDGASWRLTQFVVGGLVRSLVKKGLARDDGDGWGITDAGREFLAQKWESVQCPGVGSVNPPAPHDAAPSDPQSDPCFPSLRPCCPPTWTPRA